MAGQGMQGWLSGKGLTLEQRGPGFDFQLGQKKIGTQVTGRTAILVGRVASPVISATGTRPVDLN